MSRVAFLTGAASGIGAATARILRAEGYRVAAYDLNAASEVDLALAGDVTDRAAVEAAVARAETELGPIDACLTAAGIYEHRPLGAIGVDVWRRMVAIHVEGTANVLRPVYRSMLARGHGRICTIGSELALCGDPNAIHYAAAKGAIVGFTKALALEAAPHGIQVNCLCPGPTRTPLLKPEHAPPDYVAALPIGRVVEPEEIAAAARFLLIEEHNLVGQSFSPNAGAVI